jgi:hypothetical protein
MALNQTIFSPLTNYSGSISAYTSNNSTVLQIISSSLPVYQATGWEYRIMTKPFTTTLTAEQSVTDLQLTLQNSKKYIVEAYLGGASSATATGLRIAILTANAETHYVIQNPTSTTALGYSFSTLNNAASAPGNSITNYFLVYIKGIIITATTGNPTWTPRIFSETGGTAVGLGPSVIYYRHY